MKATMSIVYWFCALMVLFATGLWGFTGAVTSFIIACFIVAAFNSIDNRLSEIEAKLRGKDVGEHDVGLREKRSAVITAKAGTSMEIPTSVGMTPPPPKSISSPPVETTPTTSEFEEDTDPFDKAIVFLSKKLKEYIYSGNPVANVGVIILFIGVAFLLTYASNYIHFSIAVRLLGVAAAGIIFLILGWLLHSKKPVFANILEGCGVGLLFLTTYAAFKLYGLLPPLTAFSLLIGIVVISAILAVLQNAKSLAILGILGGFLAPILISTSSGSVTLLFSYYVVLNIFILAIAWFKAWPELNLLGFVATFMVSALWGWQAYQPAYCYVSEFFLALFFLFYVAIAILYSTRTSYDSIITLGTPFIVYALQAGIVNTNNINHGLAWSAVALCIFYAVTGFLIRFLRYPAMRTLTEVFLALALLFGTLAIPLASSENWTVIAWAFEGVMLMYIGIKQQRIQLRYAAALLQIGSGLLFIFNNASDFYQLKPWLNHFYLTGASVGLSGLLTSAIWNYYAKQCTPSEKDTAAALMWWGVLWWYGTGIFDISAHVSTDNVMRVITIFFACSSFAFWAANEFLGWRLLRYPALLLLPMMVLYFLSLIANPQPYSSDMLSTWCICFAILYGMLFLHEKSPADYLPSLHVVSLLLLTAVIAVVASGAMSLYLPAWPDTWHYIIWGVVPTSMLILVGMKSSLSIWPVYYYPVVYRDTCGSVLTVYVVFWIASSYLLSGNFSPLPYVPVLNPLDMLTMLSLYTVLVWCRTNSDIMYISRVVVGGLALGWATVVLLRSLHYYLNIPYDVLDLWSSPTVQTSLSIFWALFAVIAMFVATRIRSRTLWSFGIVFISVVVIKLFLVDLSSVGTLQRIITFITVGILMLINGYISPLPPKDK